VEQCATAYVADSSQKSIRETIKGRSTYVAADYDEVRSDIKESQERSLEDLQSANAPEARSVVTELDEADALDEGLTPGAEIISTSSSCR
jgi:bisphosphoglycerate-dependent phosphoglycerate mutase